MKEIRTYKYVENNFLNDLSELSNNYYTLFCTLKSDNIGVFDLHGKELENFFDETIKEMTSFLLEENLRLDKYLYDINIKNFSNFSENGEIMVDGSRNLKKIKIEDFDCILVIHSNVLSNIIYSLFTDYINNYKEEQKEIRKIIAKKSIDLQVYYSFLKNYLNKKYNTHFYELNYIIGEKSLVYKLGEQK